MARNNESPPAPYYNADCSAFSDTTWVATVIGTPGNQIKKLYIVTTIDKPLEYGFTAGTGNTHVGYIAGVPHVLVMDFDRIPLETTLWVRMKASGSAPAANTILCISAWS